MASSAECSLDGAVNYLNSPWLLNLLSLSSCSIQGLGDKALVRKQSSGLWGWALTLQTRAPRLWGSEVWRCCHRKAVFTGRRGSSYWIASAGTSIWRGWGEGMRSFVLIILHGGKVGLPRGDINISRSWITCQCLG